MFYINKFKNTLLIIYSINQNITKLSISIFIFIIFTVQLESEIDCEGNGNELDEARLVE